MVSRMFSVMQSARSRAVSPEGIGVVDGPDRPWPGGELRVACVPGPGGTRYALALPEATLQGETLTAFLAQVAPFGCPVPGSLIRAYSLPDAPFPSVLLREHEDGADGIADAYRRFLAGARHRWMAALGETGPGLCPALAWEGGPGRRFLAPDEAAGALDAAGVAPGVADDYLGRGLLLLAHRDVAAAWKPMMSLGGPTKIRKITGREFPVWVDLPQHQPDLLASPVLDRVEQLLASA